MAVTAVETAVAAVEAGSISSSIFMDNKNSRVMREFLFALFAA